MTLKTCRLSPCTPAVISRPALREFKLAHAGTVMNSLDCVASLPTHVGITAIRSADDEGYFELRLLQVLDGAAFCWHAHFNLEREVFAIDQRRMIGRRITKSAGSGNKRRHDTSAMTCLIK